MSKYAPINLSDFKAKIAEDDAIPVIAGDRTFYIRPVHLLTDAEFKAMQDSDDNDIVGQARLLVDDYDAFVAAGGSAVLVEAIIKTAAKQHASDQGVGSGESGGLLDLLTEHGEALTADFRRFYGMRLWAELGGPSLPWCEFASLSAHLPPDAALWRSMDAGKAAWSVDTAWLARAAHLLEVALWAQLDPKKRGQMPKPPSTPWDDDLKPDRSEVSRRLVDLAQRDAQRRGDRGN